MTAPLTEAEWQAQVVELAHILGWEVLHVRRSIGRRNGKAGWQTTTSIAGWPDLLMWRGPRLIAAELKSETGKATREQLRVLAGLRAAGVETFLWHPSDLPEIADALRRPTLCAGHVKGDVDAR